LPSVLVPITRFQERIERCIRSSTPTS
jgi:hypothetical protein